MPVFVDSNVIVYTKDSSNPVKQQRAEAWLDHLWRTGNGRLSTQVIQESYAVMTRKLLGIEESRSDVTRFFAWRPLVIDPETIQAAWSVQDRHSVSFWDALIIASAAAGRCETLLTEDLTHGETYAEVVQVVNPFLVAPGEPPTV